MNDFINSDLYKILAPIVGYLAGLATMLIQRFTLTKKEQNDLRQKVYENTKQLLAEQEDKFQSFVAAMAKYVNKTEGIDFDDFISIATTGEKYFYQQTVTATAILSGQVEENARKSTFVPKMIDTVEKTLPTYYRTLQKIAGEKGFKYHGKLERKNYETIYLVVEKYGAEARRD